MEPVERVLGWALQLLARRDHSEAGLRSRLEKKGASQEVVAAVLARLSELGYLDDRRVARQWAEGLVRGGRGFGPRLKFELLRRGIPEEVAAEVMAETAESHDQAELVAALVARRFCGFDLNTASAKETGRVVGYLQRRGFGIGVIMQVLRENKGC